MADNKLKEVLETEKIKENELIKISGLSKSTVRKLINKSRNAAPTTKTKIVKSLGLLSGKDIISTDVFPDIDIPVVKEKPKKETKKKAETKAEKPSEKKEEKPAAKKTAKKTTAAKTKKETTTAKKESGKETKAKKPAAKKSEDKKEE